MITSCAFSKGLMFPIGRRGDNSTRSLGASTLGLHQSGSVSCLHLVTMSEDRLGPPIGTLSPGLLQQLDACLKVALGLP